MKQLIFLFSLLSFFFNAQNFELKNSKLIKYYEIINQAERSIVNNIAIKSDNWVQIGSSYLGSAPVKIAESKNNIKAE